VIGNLFVRAAQSMPEAKMKPMLIEKAKAAGLKYGLLIRRIDFPSNATFEELQTMARQLQKHGYSRTLNAPLLAYRVYPDGREELVRGLRFREFSARELRDLEAASDRRYVLNYLNNGSSFNLAGASTDATTSSVICPSLLINNVDLEHADEDTRRLPVVPPPALASQ
jgi:TldD protein